MTSSNKISEVQWAASLGERAQSDRLSPMYSCIATSEQRHFSENDIVVLNQLAVRSLDAGIRLGFLVNVDQRLSALGLARKSLGKCFPDIKDNSIQKWFSTGEITPEHLGRLFHDDRFADDFPTISEAAFHATRWLVGSFHARKNGRTRAAIVPWHDFSFLIEAHRLDTDDLYEAFGLMPDDLVREHEDYDEDKFVTMMEKWGRCYRYVITRRRFLLKGMELE